MLQFFLIIIILSLRVCNGHIITSNVYLEDLPGYAKLQGHPANPESTFYYKAINVKVNSHALVPLKYKLVISINLLPIY